jgi:hypothetical protein
MKKVISLFLLSVSVCISIQAQKGFKIVDATAMSWAGGMPQSGHGTNYNLQIVLRTSAKISFDDLWVGGTYATKQRVFFDPRKGHEPIKGDTINVSFAVNVIPSLDPMEQTVKPVAKNKPCDYKGAALLGYKAGRKEQYKVIRSFRQLPPANYP